MKNKSKSDLTQAYKIKERKQELKSENGKIQKLLKENVKVDLQRLKLKILRLQFVIMFLKMTLELMVS